MSDPELHAVETFGSQLFEDPATSRWLKAALREALARDPVDAFQDALALAEVLEERLRAELDLNELP